METIELNGDDKVVFNDAQGKPRTFVVKDIAVQSFSNAIWRNGFLMGLMTGAALILLVIAAIIRPFTA